MKKVYCCFIVLIIIFLSGPCETANAQSISKYSQTISISPIVQDLTLQPGTTNSYSVSIANNSNNPIGMHISVIPLPVAGTSDETDTTSLNLQNFLSWISLSQQDILLKEESQQNITVTVTVPKSAQQSGYYAAIEYVPIVSQQQKRSNQPIILTHVIGLLFATVGNLNYAHFIKKVHIVDFSPMTWIIEKPQTTLQFSLANDYFTHFSAKPFLMITPLFGKTKRIPLSEKRVLPGTSRSWQEQIYLPTIAPLYFVHLIVGIGNGDTVTADTFFLLIPYHMILAIFVALCIILITVFRKRIGKAVKILFKG